MTIHRKVTTATTTTTEEVYEDFGMPFGTSPSDRTPMSPCAGSSDVSNSTLGTQMPSLINQEEDAETTNVQAPTTGRTVSDLIADNMQNPRLLFLLFYIVATMIFIAKINSINDLLLPLIAGTFFNFIWFMVWPFLCFLWRQINKK